MIFEENLISVSNSCYFFKVGVNGEEVSFLFPSSWRCRVGHRRITFSSVGGPWRPPTSVTIFFRSPSFINYGRLEISWRSGKSSQLGLPDAECIGHSQMVSHLIVSCPLLSIFEKIFLLKIQRQRPYFPDKASSVVRGNSPKRQGQPESIEIPIRNPPVIPPGRIRTVPSIRCI